MCWLEFFICKEGNKTISLDDVAALAASGESGLNFGCLASPNLKSIENTTFSNFFISDTKQQAFFAEPISAIPSCNIYLAKSSHFQLAFAKYQTTSCMPFSNARPKALVPRSASIISAFKYTMTVWRFLIHSNLQTVCFVVRSMKWLAFLSYLWI